MIGQDADSDGLERSAFLNGSIGQSQTVNMVDQQMARSIGDNDRKEEGASADFRSSILRHRELIARAKMVGTAQARLCPPYETAAKKAAHAEPPFLHCRTYA